MKQRIKIFVFEKRKNSDILKCVCRICTLYDIISQLSDDLVVYVGHRLKQKRLSVKMTQSELGSKLCVSSQQIQKYERGVNSISLRMLEKISDILKVSIEYFFEGYKEHNSACGTYLEDENQIVFEDNVMEKEVALLSKYFKKINDEDIRKKILNLVKSLSNFRESKKGK